MSFLNPLNVGSTILAAHHTSFEEMIEQSIFGTQNFGSSVAPIREYAIAIVLTTLVTAASLVLELLADHAAVSFVYLLLVVVAGLKLSRGPVLFVAASSALAWYTIFIPPRFAFHIGTLDDAMIFTTFFAVAMAMGHLTSRLRLKEVAERNRERRTAALYELVQQAGLTPDLDRGLSAAIRLIETLFGVRAALLLRRPDHTLAEPSFSTSSFSFEAKERCTAEWAFSHQMPAGKFTGALPDADAMHLPLRAHCAVMGILSIHPPPGTTFDLAGRELLETFAVLIGTILEKDELLQAAKRAEILEASERLQRALLQSVSHELKTPLSAVHTGIDALARQLGSSDRNQTTLRETQQALRRLHRVINNLLDMTRVESGVVHPRVDWCEIGELVQAAIDLAADGVGERAVEVDIVRGLPIVKVDQALLEQCLCNLLLNAASHSQPGTKITIRARFANGRVMLSVLDEGSGIPEPDLPHIFETFHRGAGAPPGGTGLGLAIVDGFVRAHGGNVAAANRLPRGAEFTITIPADTMRPDALESFA
jgi:two-component system sensor histidine kinase KdpD